MCRIRERDHTDPARYRQAPRLAKDIEGIVDIGDAFAEKDHVEPLPSPRQRLSRFDTDIKSVRLAAAERLPQRTGAAADSEDPPSVERDMVEQDRTDGFVIRHTGPHPHLATS